MWVSLKDSLLYKTGIAAINGFNTLISLLFAHSQKKNKNPLLWLERSAVFGFTQIIVGQIHKLQEAMNRAGQKSYFFGESNGYHKKNTATLEKVDGWMIIFPINFMFIDFAMRKIGAFERVSGIWDEVMLFGLIGYLVLRPLWLKTGYRFRYGAIDLMVTFFFMVGIGLFSLVSPESNVAIDGFRAVYQYLLWFFIFRQMIQISNRRLTLTNLVLSGAFLGWHSVYQIVRNVPMPGNWVDSTETITTRAFSIIGSPNILSAIFVLLLPVVFTIACTEKKSFLKWLAWSALPVMLFGLLYTYSRQAYLAIGGAVAIYFVLFYPKVLKYLIVALGAGLMAFKSIANRIFYLFTPEYFAKSAKGGRIIRYQYAIEQWLEKPWFGQGLGRFGGAVATHYELTPFYVDSYYFKTLGEMGAIGLGALFALLLTTLAHVKRLIQRQTTPEHMLMVMGMFIGLLGLVIQNAVENIFEVPLMIIWFWAIVAIALTYEPSEQ